MKHVCIPCGRKMPTVKIGVTVIEYRDRAKTIPYRLWQADLKECVSCPAQALNFAEKATESFHERFDVEIKAAQQSPSTIHFY